MTLQDKIDGLTFASKEEDCCVESIENGWIINAVPVKKEELSPLFKRIFQEVDSEKKRINSLLVLKDIGKQSTKFLSELTKIALTNRLEEKKFLEQYSQTVIEIIDSLDQYIATLEDSNQVTDLGTLFDIVEAYQYSSICWKRRTELEPESIFGWIRLSFSYLLDGKSKEALNVIWRGLAWFGYNLPFITTKGKLDPKYRYDVEKLVNLLQKKEKKNYRVYYLQGLVALTFHNDIPLAKELFIKSLKSNSAFIDAELQLANCLRKEKNYKGQEKIYKRILAKEKTETRALFGLATVYKESLDIELAVHYLTILYQLEPENPRWAAELAKIYRHSTLQAGEKTKKTWKRDLKKAYFFYKKMMKTQEEDKNQVLDFYSLLVEMTQYEEAKELLIDFMGKNGPDKELLNKLESIYGWLNLPYDGTEIMKEINYLQNKDTTYPKLLDLLSTVRPNIPISLARIAKHVNFPEKRMIALLKKLVTENPSLGEYLELEQVFIRKEDTDIMITSLKAKYSTCFRKVYMFCYSR
jgi:hypothetical protein